MLNHLLKYSLVNLSKVFVKEHDIAPFRVIMLVVFEYYLQYNIH